VVTGGVMPYSYDWSTGETTQSISVGQAGTYQVTVTGPNGCSDTDSIVITQSLDKPLVTIDPSATELTCAVTTITLDTVVTGGVTPYTYAWSTGETSESIVVTAPGTYMVTVTGDNGCSDSATVTITQSTDKPGVSIVAPDTVLTCEVGSATLTAVAVGGAGPFSYLWSTGETTQSIIVDQPGTYQVTVTGDNGCSDSVTITITQSTDRPEVSIVAPDTVLTCDITEVTLTAQVAPETGVAAFSYLWSNGSTDPSMVVAEGGTYTVTVTGEKGCSGAASVVITEDQEPPVVSIATPEPLSATVSEVVLDATVSGGTSPYTYLWDTGATTEDVTVSATGTYTLTVTGANGCSAQASVDVVYQGLEIVKTGQTETAELGDILDYTITVTNVGDVSLTNVTAADAKLGINQNVGALAPGASAVVTGSYEVTEADIPADLEPGDTSFMVRNTATATSDQVGSVEDSWDVTVNYQFQAPRAALAITKTGPDGPVAAGDVVEYTIRVANAGETALHNVHIVDAMLGLDETLPLLDVRCSLVLQEAYLVTEADIDEASGLTNMATAWSDEAPEVVGSWHVDTVSTQVPSDEPPDEPVDGPQDDPTDVPSENPGEESAGGRADVTVIVSGGWDGIPVRAWVGGTEQQTLYTERNSSGEPQVMWTFYPPADASWTVSVVADLPAGVDSERWTYHPLAGTSVQIEPGQRHVIYLQLVDEGGPATAVAPAVVLPHTGCLDEP